MLIPIVHIFLTGPLLAYVGLMKPAFRWVYWLLFGLGIGALAYILWDIVKHGMRPWLLVHALVLLPVLLWVGWMGVKAPAFLFSLLLAFGCAAIGYHLVKVVYALN